MSSNWRPIMCFCHAVDSDICIVDMYSSELSHLQSRFLRDSHVSVSRCLISPLWVKLKQNDRFYEENSDNTSGNEWVVRMKCVIERNHLVFFLFYSYGNSCQSAFFLHVPTVCLFKVAHANTPVASNSIWVRTPVIPVHLDGLIVLLYYFDIHCNT